MKAAATEPPANKTYGMSTLAEIEQAVRNLAAEDLAAFRAWFAQYDAGDGNLDMLPDEASSIRDASLPGPLYALPVEVQGLVRR